MSNGWYQLERERRQKPTSYSPMYAGRNTQRTAPSATPPQAKPAPQAERQTGPLPVPSPEAAPTPSAVPAPRQEGKLPDPYGDQLAVKHSQTVGERGPVVLQDGVLHEALEEFTHEKIVERAVHVKGWGALGHFTCEHDMSAYTTLPFLQRPGVRVPTVSRFSLAVSNKGTPDTSRNVRGFSTKFYADEGVFDLLCNHLPVFAVRDAIRFPETIKALLPAPNNNLLDPERFWDFVARAPEAANFVTWLYSDVGTVKSLRRLRTYGVNTYVWKNAKGIRRFVKYHWIPLAGAEFLTAQEAAALAGQDPDCAGRDLYDAIRRGEYPEYELRVQLMDCGDVETLPYDPLDDTKVWSEEDYPLMPVGRLTLDRNPDNYMDQVEKLAFSPSNLLEGAELSDDKMLQGRSFVYTDAQRYRLGPDFRKIPVNAQKGWTPDRQVSTGLGVETAGVQMRSAIARTDDFAQAGEYYRSLTPEWRAHLADNLANDLKAAPELVRKTVLGYLSAADADYGAAVAKRMGQ